MDSSKYANHLEKKLIEQFKITFFEKMGYYPTILTKVRVDGDVYMPLMPLATLEKYFEPFLPSPYGFVLPLSARCRCKELVELRVIYSYLARLMKYSLNSIGNSLGNRDHTTIMNCITNFNNFIKTDEAFRQKYLFILSHINQQHESSIMANLDQVQHESEPAVLSGLQPIQDQTHQYDKC